MTAPLGSDICPRLGCGRHRHVSPSGIHYGTCLAHASELLSRAFGEDPDEARFWSKVDRRGGPEACWPWTAAVDRWGYGRFALRRHQEVGAHRQAYVFTAGRPTGLVTHTCDNPRCCNPAHLKDGTPAENMADMVQRGRSRNQHNRHIPLPNAALASPSWHGVRQGGPPPSAPLSRLGSR